MQVIKITDAKNRNYYVRKYKRFFIQDYCGPVFNPEGKNKNCYIVSELINGCLFDAIGEIFCTINECKQAINDFYDPTGAMIL